jgi:hypothetical protein
MMNFLKFGLIVFSSLKSTHCQHNCKTQSGRKDDDPEFGPERNGKNQQHNQDNTQKQRRDAGILPDEIKESCVGQLVLA